MFTDHDSFLSTQFLAVGAWTRFEVEVEVDDEATVRDDDAMAPWEALLLPLPPPTLAMRLGNDRTLASLAAEGGEQAPPPPPPLIGPTMAGPSPLAPPPS